MVQSNKVCPVCHELGHSKFYCKKKPSTPIKRTPIKQKIVVRVPGEKPKKRVKSQRTKLKKQLELLVKEYVKRRDNYTCQYCHLEVTGTNCHASHVIPVSRSANLQFDPLNMKVLCFHHHINWWHKNPLEAGEWYRQTFPERWEYLEALYKLPTVPTKEWQLQELIDEYKLKLKERVT